MGISNYTLMNVCCPTFGKLTRIFAPWSNPHPLPALPPPPPPHGVYIDRCITVGTSLLSFTSAKRSLQDIPKDLKPPLKSEATLSTLSREHFLRSIPLENSRLLNKRPKPPRKFYHLSQHTTQQCQTFKQYWRAPGVLS